MQHQHPSRPHFETLSQRLVRVYESVGNGRDAFTSRTTRNAALSEQLHMSRGAKSDAIPPGLTMDPLDAASEDDSSDDGRPNADNGGEPGYDRMTRYETTANHTYNSLDFEEVENDILQDDRARGVKSRMPRRAKQWLILLMIAVLTAAVAGGIDKGIEGLMAVKFNAVTHFMESSAPPPPNLTHPNATAQDERRTIPFVAPFFVYILINAAYVSVAGMLVVFGEPVARGSGIGEVKCVLNGVRIPRLLRLKTLVCKAVGILFSVASGLPCGKEGPMIHSGSAIASGLCTGKSTMMHCDTGFFKEFRSDKERRTFITAGSAAGVGAAFGAPVGGLLFAVEEVGSFWSLDLTTKVFLCAAITPWVLQVLLDPSSVAHPTIGGLIDFGTVPGTFDYSEMPFVFVLGCCGGLIGAAFIALNIELTKLRRRYVKSRAAKMTEVILVNILTSLVLILLVLRGYSCNSDAEVKLQMASSKIQRYGCKSDEYNDMATYFFRSMEDSISVLLHTDVDIPVRTLVMQVVPYFFLMTFTYGIYVPSGLFLPTLALGASFGHLYAQAWNSVLPAHLALKRAHFALYGGTAILGGATRMTISIIVIVMEATGNTGFFYPLVVIAMCAKLVGDRLTPGVYEAHLRLNGVPLLGTKLKPAFASLKAVQVMSQDVPHVQVRATVRQVKMLLRATPFHNAIIVTEPDSDRLAGLILRRAAIIMIAKGAAQRRLAVDDFIKGDREREYFRAKKYGLLDDKPGVDNLILDFGPYMDRWPYTVQMSMPLPRVFRIYRELGLRHVIVIDEHENAVGLIGRKQLCFLRAMDAGDDDATPDDTGHGGPAGLNSSPSTGCEAADVQPTSAAAIPVGGSPTAAGSQPKVLNPSNAARDAAGGTSPRTFSKRPMTGKEVAAAFRTRMSTLADHDDWRDAHIDTVT